MTAERPINRIALKEALNHIHEFIDSQDFFIRDVSGHRWLDSLCLAFVSKALAIARGIICLTEANLGEEAFGLMRTLLELALNLRYITNGRSPELRAKRFIQFQSKIKMEWARRGVQHFRWSKKWTRDALPRYQKFVRLEKKYHRQSWYQTKKNKAWTGTLALEPDRFEKVPLKDDSGRVVVNKRGKSKMVGANWAFDYFWIYFWTSSFVHVNVDCLSNHAANLQKPFRVYVEGAQPSGYGSTDFGEQALFSLTIYLRAILIFAYRGLNSEPPEELLNKLQAIAEEAAGEEAVARAKQSVIT